MALRTDGLPNIKLAYLSLNSGYGVNSMEHDPHDYRVTARERCPSYRRRGRVAPGESAFLGSLRAERHGHGVNDFHRAHQHRVGLDAEVGLANDGLARQSPCFAEILYAHPDLALSSHTTDLQRAGQVVATFDLVDVAGVEADLGETVSVEDPQRIRP